MKHTKQWINGEWTTAVSGDTWDVINPATEEVLCTVPFGSSEDAQLAIQAAEQAFPVWRGQTAYDRAKVLHKTSRLIAKDIDRLSRITVEESGKPLAQAKGEWGAAMALLEWFAESGKRSYGRTIPSRDPQKRLIVHRQPIGVVGVITAWNFPVYNTTRSWAAALAAGCSIVARPSEYTPLSAMALCACLEEAGMPPGVVNLINGNPEAMGAALLESPVVRMISFTGSVRVGKILIEGSAKTVKKLALELGGNAPVIVLPDAPLEEVALASVQNKFRNCGQVCVSPQRFFIPGSRLEEFTDLTHKAIQELTVGSGLDPETDVGPLINKIQHTRVEQMVEAARNEGGEIIHGGKRPDDFEKGYFYEPTLIRQLDVKSSSVNNEIFGPVMPLLSFDDIEEAVAEANATDYGLAAYVFTKDMKTARYAQEHLDFGMIGINTFSPQCVEGPFGGFKQSGIGRECGEEGLHEYQEEKLVCTVI